MNLIVLICLLIINFILWVTQYVLALIAIVAISAFVWKRVK